MIVLVDTTHLWFPLQSHNSTSQLAVFPGDISIPLHSNSRILLEEKLLSVNAYQVSNEGHVTKKQ